MLSHFPRNMRTHKLLRFLANHCYGLAAEIENSSVEDVSKEWHEIVDNLTDAQLKIGCEWIKEHQEPFIKPIRFRFLAHGLIDPSRAYEQAKDKIYKHPAVQRAAIKAEIHRNSGTDEQVYQKFGRVYAHICDKIIKGEELCGLPKKVAPQASQPPRKPRTDAQKNHCRQVCNEILKNLGSAQIHDKSDK